MLARDGYARAPWEGDRGWGSCMDADRAASTLVERVRNRPWGLAAVAIDGDDADVRLDDGDDPLDERSVFQIGSVTKTMMGVLLADAILRAETSAEATLGAVLGFDGGVATATLGQLAAHRGGLPRLPPNLDLDKVNLSDPYAAYTEHDLLTALRSVDLERSDQIYSNFGFMALGVALATVTGTPIPTLFASRLFTPLGMNSAGCPPSEADRVPGYAGPTRTPWWTTQLPGAGGVGASIRDLCAYLRAHVDPPPGPLGGAIRLATPIEPGVARPVGYGWSHQGGGWWHNGGTGGFRSFVAFHRPTRTAVGLLANSADADVVDSVGLATLTEMVHAS